MRCLVRSGRCALALVALVLAVPAAAQAATFTVTRSDDPEPPGACDADCSLREAIRAVNAGAGGDTILIGARTVTLTADGTGEDAALTGDLDFTKSVTVRGAGSGATTVNAQGVDRVFHVIGVDSPSVTLEDLTVTGGRSASDGGGLFVEPGGALAINRATVTDNAGDGLTTDGGGIESRGTLSVTDSTIVGNRTTDDGAGIVNRSGTLTVTGSTISGNEAKSNTGPGGDAGGILNLGTATVANSTISGNYAKDDAGALYNGGAITLTNVTIAGNSADTGGAIYYQSGPATVRNVIVAGNSAVSFSPNCSGMAIPSAGHNIEDRNECGFSGLTDRRDTDPRLGPLAANGGPTLTHALLDGSPAIDGGDDAACAATDQRGARRPSPAGAACDVGALEARSLADLSVSPATLAPAYAQEELTFVVPVRDEGPDDTTGVSTLHTLSGAAGIVAALPSQGSCTVAGAVISCAVGAVARGMSATVRVVVRPTKAGSLTLDTHAASDQTDPNVANDDARQSAQIRTERIKPLLTRLALSPSALLPVARGGSVAPAAAKRGARVRYRLSEPARVTFNVDRRAAGRRVGRRCRPATRANRKRKACVRWVRLRGSFAHRGKQGANALRFTGRLRRKALPAGRYRLVAAPRDAARNSGVRRTVAFRVRG